MRKKVEVRLRRAATRLNGSLGENRAEPEVQVAREILDYFLRNPAAADSPTGIARWRLMEDFVERSVDATLSALSWLVEKGYLQELSAGGEHRIFRLNVTNRQAAETFLQQPEQLGKQRK